MCTGNRCQRPIIESNYTFPKNPNNKPPLVPARAVFLAFILLLAIIAIAMTGCSRLPDNSPEARLVKAKEDAESRIAKAQDDSTFNIKLARIKANESAALARIKDNEQVTITEISGQKPIVATAQSAN